MSKLAKALTAAAGNAAGESLYVEDVFSTYLYTGTGSTQTITNGIDLAGDGGMVWMKSRNSGLYTFSLYDTERGATKELKTNKTAAESTQSTGVTGFNSNGFSIGALTTLNNSSTAYASWAFRKAAKFFDVVTWTGNGVAGKTINHSLNAVPGCIIVKRTDSATYWVVYHKSLDATIPQNKAVFLNTAQTVVDQPYFNDSAPTSTSFQVGSDSWVNGNGGTYVAYLFASDAGGFGEDGSQSVVSCGSYTGNGTTPGPIASFGFEPQWILIKAINESGAWYLFDSMRGFGAVLADESYFEITSDGTESTGLFGVNASSVGIELNTRDANWNTSGTKYLYIAIRKGKMKIPESGTEVFSPTAYTGTNVDNRLVDTGILTDMVMARIRTASSSGGFYVAGRSTGNGSLATASTDSLNNDSDSFMSPVAGGYGISFSAMNGFGVGNDATRQLNQSSTPQLAYAFRQAAGFMDVVCYSGTGVARTVNHNLGVVPEMLIFKRRDASRSWAIVHANAVNRTSSQPPVLTGYDVSLGFTVSGGLGGVLNGTSPTNSLVTISSSSDVNVNGGTYVAYLFASCPGVSKVGSYTGTGTTKQIDCGFSGGARFVLIKRCDADGDWYVWDTARGIVAGNDPYLLLNSTAAEVTSTDYIDPYSAGFEISSTAPAAINANGGTFIYLAIA